MFHTYVLAFSGTVIDFDRAAYLMDRKLLQASIRAMIREQNLCPRYDALYDAQWVFDYYCARHFEKYDKPFGPDVIPHWDCGPSSRAAAPAPRSVASAAVMSGN